MITQEMKNKIRSMTRKEIISLYEKVKKMRKKKTTHKKLA